MKDITVVTQLEVDDTSKEDDASECFVAFARVFSGSIKKGSKLYVLGPKYQPELFNENKECEMKCPGDR